MVCLVLGISVISVTPASAHPAGITQLIPHQAWICNTTWKVKDCNYLETNLPVSDAHYVILDATTGSWYYPNPTAVPPNCNDWCNMGLYGNHNHIGVHTFWA